MLYKWKYPENGDQNNLKNFNEYNIPQVVQKILISRQIINTDLLKKFIYPKLKYLYNPFIFPDMEKAVTRIIAALKNGENILIYGDYDVDGVTSVCILYEAFHELGGKVLFYIPDRNKEGYGISDEGINQALKKNVTLIITVDCGITAVEQIDKALSGGIDTIICDHHENIGKQPNAYAILNPKHKNNPYPCKDLAGCGVTFKLLQGVCDKLGVDDEFSYSFLDYVALGTAADIVNIVDENRILVYHGLKRINEGKRFGINSLIGICGFNSKDIRVSNIVFSVAPRINAVGRISSAKKAVHLLTSKSEQQSKNIARILNEENNKRKKIDERTLFEAEQIIGEETDFERDCIIVLQKEGWHIGVIGIVASRLLEKYGKPVILISTENGVGRASARSTESFDLIYSLKKLENLLTSFGGHKKAAGFSIKSENIKQFKTELNKIAGSLNEPLGDKQTLKIDSEITLDQFTPELFKWLKTLEPYGPGNMRPVFVSKRLSVFGDIQKVADSHLKFKVKRDGFVIDAIAFNMEKLRDELATNDAFFNFAYVIEENNWQGQTAVQLRIKDFEVTHGRK
jgi:single-stranded-DNA-specific exonuclease